MAGRNIKELRVKTVLGNEPSWQPRLRGSLGQVTILIYLCNSRARFGSGIRRWVGYVRGGLSGQSSPLSASWNEYYVSGTRGEKRRGRCYDASGLVYGLDNNSPAARIRFFPKMRICLEQSYSHFILFDATMRDAHLAKKKKFGWEHCQFFFKTFVALIVCQFCFVVERALLWWK